MQKFAVKARAKRVLDAGSGLGTKPELHPAFAGWSVVRLDIDARVKPDLQGSIVDMRGLVADGTFDAVWSSHSLEHLYAHDVPRALSEFRRVLRPDGFALVTCPDLKAVAELVVRDELDKTAYPSPAGPVTALDMLYGFGPSIAKGNAYMGHKTGFTATSMGKLMLRAGFSEVWTASGGCYDLWAVGLMPRSDAREVNARVSKLPGRFVPIA